MKLGELFIELGITGDIKPLKQALSGMNAASIKAKLLTKYLRDLKKAKTAEEKATIKSNFAQKINTLNTIENTKAIGGLIKAASITVAKIAAVVVIFDRLNNSLLKSNQLFVNFTKQTGLSISRLNRLAGVAKLSGMGLSAEQVANDLTNLEQRIFKLGLTGEGSGIFAQLGMNPMGMKSDQFIEALRHRMKGLSEVQQTYIVDQLGLSREWLNVLTLNDKEYAELMKESQKLQLSEKERKELAKYTALQQKNNMRWDLAKQRFLKTMMPLIIGIMEGTSKIADFLAKAFNDQPVRIVRDIALFIGIAATKAKILQASLKGIGALGALFGFGAGKGLFAKLFGFGASKQLAKTGAKVGAKAALGGSNVWNPIGWGLLAWTLWDIFQLLKDWFNEDKEKKDEEETESPFDEDAWKYSYQNINSNMINHFHNNPVPQQEVINNLNNVVDKYLAGTKR